MKEHNIFRLKKNLETLTYQASCLANFKENHDRIHSAFAETFLEDSHFYGRIKQAGLESSAIANFLCKMNRILTEDWLPTSKSLNSLEEIGNSQESFLIKFKGLETPTVTTWTQGEHSLEVEAKFTECSLRIEAKLFRNIHSSIREGIEITSVFIDNKKLADFVEKDLSDSQNKVIERSITTALESLLDTYLLFIGEKDCSSFETIQCEKEVIYAIENIDSDNNENSNVLFA